MEFFQPVKQLTRRFITLNVNRFIYVISSTVEFKTLVIDLNTKEQLFEGVNSKGEELENIRGFGYAQRTIEIKKEKGLPYDRITLFDTGDFYDTFKVIPFLGGFEIDANPIKENTNLFDEFGEDILGLTEESREILVQYYTDVIRRELIGR